LSAPAEGALPDLKLFKDEKIGRPDSCGLLKPTSAFPRARRARKQVFENCDLPFLTKWQTTADPDAVLISSSASSKPTVCAALLFELLATNPDLLELVFNLSTQQVRRDLLIRPSAIAREITRDKNFNQPRSIAEHWCST